MANSGEITTSQWMKDDWGNAKVKHSKEIRNSFQKKLLCQRLRSDFIRGGKKGAELRVRVR